MSNNKNLAALASALDDGTTGQVLQSTGSGGVAFADAGGSGVTAHTNQDAMISADASSPYTEGSLHYVLNTNKLYVKMGDTGGAGFFQIAAITNTSPTISSPSPNTVFVLNSDGTPTTVSVTATDDEVGQTLNYYYVVTSGSIGSGTTITTSATASGTYSSSGNAVAGSSNASTNSHFRITPSTSVATSFSLTFYVTDGTNIQGSACSFSLSFAVLNSNTTELLLTGDNAGDNNNIVDTPASGGSAKSVDVTDGTNVIAGSFSPYAAEYSVAFNGSTDYLSVPIPAFGSSDFSVSMWLYPTGYGSSNLTAIIDTRSGSDADTNGFAIFLDSNLKPYLIYNNNDYSSAGDPTLNMNEWNYLVLNYI